jgi:hypothetical protein
MWIHKKIKYIETIEKWLARWQGGQRKRER